MVFPVCGWFFGTKICLGWQSKVVPRVLRTLNSGRVNHLNTFGGGVCIRAAVCIWDLWPFPKQGS